MTLDDNELDDVIDAWRRAGESIRNFGSTVEAAAVAIRATIEAYREAISVDEDES